MVGCGKANPDVDGAGEKDRKGGKRRKNERERKQLRLIPA